MGIKADPNKPGHFVVRVDKRHPETGKPLTIKRAGIKTKREAERVNAELIVAMHEKIKRQVTPLWPDLLNKYFQSLEISEVTEQTKYNREKVLRCHTLPAWESKSVDEITKDDIYALLNERLGSNAESHRKAFIKYVKSVFQFAVFEGYVERNPTPLLKWKLNDKIRSVLTEVEIVTLLRRAQEIDWEWYPHCAAAIYTGMRNGELFALTWDKVDLERRTIKVDCSWSSKDGTKSTKSGDDRIVEIPSPLLPTLRELKLNAAGSIYVLPRMHKWEKGEQAQQLRLFLKLNGLPQMRFHDLRATWATLLLSKGVAPAKVMSMGGWKDMNTMMIYMRKAGIDIKGSTSCLDEMQTHGIQRANILEFR